MKTLSCVAAGVGLWILVFLNSSWLHLAWELPSWYLNASMLGMITVCFMAPTGAIQSVSALRSTKRGKAYSGNVIGSVEMAIIKERFERWEKEEQVEVTVTNRNDLWIGRSLVTGEDVYMQGEQLFQGILILGATRSGKTSRFFMSMMKQLGIDPKNLTNFLFFVCKGEDAEHFLKWQNDHGRLTVPWAIVT